VNEAHGEDFYSYANYTVPHVGRAAAAWILQLLACCSLEYFPSAQLCFISKAINSEQIKTVGGENGANFTHKSLTGYQ
jgi:hypothetical protein